MNTPSGIPLTLIVQIPCHNEEETLPPVIRDLPSAIPGIDRIIVLVIDDGSTDRTAAVAREHGAEVIRLSRRRGLARAFLAGLDRAIKEDGRMIFGLVYSRFGEDECAGCIAGTSSSRPTSCPNACRARVRSCAGVDEDSFCRGFDWTCRTRYRASFSRASSHDQ